jgi:DNA polymerase
MTPRGGEEWPGAQPWVPERHDVAVLGDAARTCRGCDLYRDATQVVMGSGDPSAGMVLVGEQPGDKEDLAGEPFVGPAGRLLDKALDAAGVDAGTAYRTNAVKHFRFEVVRGKQRMHKSPARWQVAACQPWLLAELDAVRPDVVVLLGATAGQAVYGSGFRIGDARGRRLSWPEELGGVRPGAVYATVHPASVLRSRTREEAFDSLVADLRLARNALPRTRKGRSPRSGR